MCAIAGSRSKWANCLSFTGLSMLQRSFEPIPITSSLISELPILCTWR